MKNSTALITGIHGFTGYHLSHALQKAGIRVFGSTHQTPDKKNRIIPMDLTDPDSIQAAVAFIQPDYVFHLAGISFVAHEDIDAFEKVNVKGTQYLLQALAQLKSPPKSVLIASSSNIYGNVRIEQIDENTPPNPENAYAKSKLRMEQITQQFKDDLSLVITRPFNYTGTGQCSRFLIPKMVEHFQQKKPAIILGNLDVWRDFSDVRTLVQAYIHLIQTAPRNTCVNICSGQTHALREILELLSRLSGHQLSVEVNPEFIRKDEVIRLQGNPEKLNQLVPNLTHIPIKDTLEWMLSVHG
jgi:nucleoside-diphosphate-sugar epimerase